MRYAFLMSALTLLLLIACGVDPTPAQTPRSTTKIEAEPTSTPLPQSTGEATPPPVQEHLWLELGDGVLAAFVEGLSPELPGKVAYVTHVPSGSQAILDRQGSVIERHGGRDDGQSRLDAVLADESAMERIMTGLQSDEDASRRQSIADWTHFINFDGIKYRAKGSLTGPVTVGQERLVTAEDLGPEIYRVALRLEGYERAGFRLQDGVASYLDPGTPVYTVVGYAPEFRLATVSNGRTILFEADTNPAAKTGADLLDIQDKVFYISLNSTESGHPELATIDDPEAVEELVDMVISAPVNQDVRDREGEWYYLAFHLNDATAVVRPFWPESGELSRGIMTPESFRLSILEALAESGALAR